MTQEQAYQKAKEGGYSGRVYSERGELLDPLFWKSLETQLNIRKIDFYRRCPNNLCEGHKEKYWRGTHCCFCGVVQEEVTIYLEDWIDLWVKFIHHLASGKSIESFFESLN